MSLVNFRRILTRVGQTDKTAWGPDASGSKNKQRNFKLINTLLYQGGTWWPAIRQKQPVSNPLVSEVFYLSDGSDGASALLFLKAVAPIRAKPGFLLGLFVLTKHSPSVTRLHSNCIISSTIKNKTFRTDLKVHRDEGNNISSILYDFTANPNYRLRWDEGLFGQLCLKANWFPTLTNVHSKVQCGIGKGNQ